MDETKFQQIANSGLAAIRTALTVPADMLGGQLMAYTAHFRDQEVVVLGFNIERDGHVDTKPLAILMDGEIFDQLEVQDEFSRFDSQGNEVAPKVRKT